MTDSKKKFIIRVYGIIIKDGKVLLSDEFRMGMKMTKFPGGGLEYGEGTIDCLKRECMEEFGQEVEILKHVYTTDYFQEAMFFEDHQLISIYYLARFKDQINFKISKKPFDFKEPAEGNQSFRWESLTDLSESDITFPIDKKVLEKLKLTAI